jgi:predicted O-methyltransferase YrrM
MTIIKKTPVTPALFDYMESHSLLAHPILAKVVEETAKRSDSIMQIPRHQGGFMHLLVKLMGVKEAIEVGCYTGYSAISVATALPAGGHLTAFDVDPVTAKIATGFFTEAGLSDVVRLVVGDARLTLKDFIARRGKNFVDLAFIDADKVNYETYYELCLEAIKPNGLLILDNTFRDGDVLNPSVADEGTKAMERLTRKIGADKRVEATMIPIADGLLMVRKK